MSCVTETNTCTMTIISVLDSVLFLLHLNINKFMEMQLR